MAKEKDESGQLVNDQGVNAQVTTEQGVKGQVATGEAAESQQTQDEQQVPYPRFKEVNEQKNAAEEAQRLAEQELQQAKDQMALMQANQPQVQQQKRISTYEQALRDCGLAGQDYLTQDEQIKVNSRQEELMSMKYQQQQQNAADIQFAQSHSDFRKVVGHTNPTGLFVPSTELEKILTEKPYLRASCGTAQGAYEIVMNERKLATLVNESESLQQHQQELEVDAKLKPMSSSSVSDSAVERKGAINESSTTEDVRAMEQRVKRGEFG